MADLTKRVFSNREADRLSAVPLTLAEAVQAVKDALIPHAPEHFERVKQELTAKAERERHRDDSLTPAHSVNVFHVTRYHPGGDEYTVHRAECKTCGWTIDGDESDVRDAAWIHESSAT